MALKWTCETCDTRRPKFALAGEPVVIGVTAYVLSISAVSEVEMVSLKSSIHLSAAGAMPFFPLLSLHQILRKFITFCALSIMWHVPVPLFWWAVVSPGLNLFYRLVFKKICKYFFFLNLVVVMSCSWVLFCKLVAKFQQPKFSPSYISSRMLLMICWLNIIFNIVH